MADHYRPNGRVDERYRGRDYQDVDDAQYSNDNNFSRRHRDRRSRSRSPARRLDYDDDRGYDSGRYADSSYRYREPSYQQVHRPSYYSNRSDQLRFRQDIIQRPGMYETAPRQPPQGPQSHFHHSRNQGLGMMYDQPYGGPPPNHGDIDVAKDYDSSKKDMVLVREIKQNSSEELFAKGLEKLYRDPDEFTGGAAPHSLKRVILIRDRRTDESMGFGFAEYFTAKDALAAVEKAREKETRDQMTIASSKVSVCFPRSAVFVHDSADLKPERNAKFKFKLFEGYEHKYHDRRYYGSVLEVNEQSPYAPAESVKTSSDGEKKKKNKKKQKKNSETLGEGTLDGGPRKRKAANSGAPAILNNWTEKQAELRYGKAEAVALKAAASTVSPPEADVRTTQATETVKRSDQQTFAHISDDLIACYLCDTGFQMEKSVWRHLRESKLHAGNLADETTIKEAYARLAMKKIDPASTLRLPPLLPAAIGDAAAASPAPYFDRAAARREMTAVAAPVSFSIKRGMADAAAASSDNGAKPAPAFGKGSKMLAKHGYSEGQGLGSRGEGRTEALETNVYATGVGLGHKESLRGDAVEEAEKATTEGYAEAGKDRMRRRYDEV